MSQLNRRTSSFQPNKILVDDILQEKLAKFLHLNPYQAVEIDFALERKNSQRYLPNFEYEKNYGIVRSAVFPHSRCIDIVCDRINCNITAHDDNYGGNSSCASLKILQGNLKMLIGKEVTSIETFRKVEVQEFFS